MPRKTPIAQILLLIFLVLLILLASIGSTLYFKGVSLGDFTHEVGDALGLEYESATLTDARLACERELRKRFKKRIQVMHMDSLSTRLDEADNLYKVYLEADVYADESRQGPTREMFINCFVSTDRGRVVSFQFAGDSLEDTGDGSGNYFGL